MPPASDTAAALADLHSRLARLIDVARQDGHDQALNEVRSLVGGGTLPSSPVRRGSGRPRGSKNKPKAPAAAATKPAKKRRNSWAGLSPEARLARYPERRIMPSAAA